MVIKKVLSSGKLLLKKIFFRNKWLQSVMGANDLEMLSSASLGIAFNAKSFLRERAAGSLSLPNLDALLYFVGISRN